MNDMDNYICECTLIISLATEGKLTLKLRDKFSVLRGPFIHELFCMHCNPITLT